MTSLDRHGQRLKAALSTIPLPVGIHIRPWSEADFPALQRLFAEQGWTTPLNRPEEARAAWQASWPALVMTEGEQVIGVVRGLTDGEITTYIAELLVAPTHRHRGLGRLLLDACHALHPHTRLDLIASDEANAFYKTRGFRLVGEGLRKSYR
jgi:GNAT superfamily N-acetyltransferase